MALVVACGDDGGATPTEDSGSTTGTPGTTGSEGADETGSSGSSGEVDVDANCSVRYRWEPGGGDVSSFPTLEMVAEDASTPTGYRVSLSVDDYPDLSGYGPYTDEIATAMSSLDGFGIQGEAFARFDGALDAKALPPANAEASVDDAIGIVVMPEGGEPYLAPVGVELTDGGETVMVYPMFPLPHGTNVAFWIKSDFAVSEGDCLAASAGMRELLDNVEGEVGDALTALRDMGVVESGDDLATLQPYPTQSTARVSYAVAEHIANMPESEFTLTDTTCELTEEFNYCTSTFSSTDYRNAEGVVTVDVDAVEGQTSWDLVVHSWLPLTGTAPYPTVLYGHGLTGSGEQGSALAGTAIPRGYAVVGISALMHGDHPSLGGKSLDGLLATLAFFAADLEEGKIDALRLRDHLRQSTYDKLHVTRLLQSGPDLDGDETPDVDPEQLAYLGISLGGVMGSELLALTDAFQGGVLIMPGGRVTTVMTDPMGSFVDVLSLLVPGDFSDGDERRLFALLQTVLDGGDPSTYGANVLHDRLDFAPNAPDLLVGAVLDDNTVVNAANWALSRALGIDIVPPTLRPVPGLGETAAVPVSGNMADGVTAGLLQFDVIANDEGEVIMGTHINLSFSEVGLTAWWGFLDSLFADGTATINDPYVEVGLDHAR
ncbi:MAG: hypothetical protein AAF799_29825 [Myxococcota bacterium]